MDLKIKLPTYTTPHSVYYASFLRYDELRAEKNVVFISTHVITMHQRYIRTERQTDWRADHKQYRVHRQIQRISSSAAIFSINRLACLLT